MEEAEQGRLTRARQNLVDCLGGARESLDTVHGYPAPLAVAIGGVRDRGSELARA
ncbi:hypothetical protein ACFYYB_03245 [Streptomyces sp. NPDC002886]|uniref:hypothetical protein n=1 Tax=Streptomyces sp. NPDC002886 TaxID=3364667 RepID=UPI003688DAF3